MCYCYIGQASDINLILHLSGLVLEDKDLENGVVVTVSEDTYKKGCVLDVNDGLQVKYNNHVKTIGAGCMKMVERSLQLSANSDIPTA